MMMTTMLLQLTTFASPRLTMLEEISMRPVNEKRRKSIEIVFRKGREKKAGRHILVLLPNSFDLRAVEDA
jgi:hypothetical protein